MIKRYQVKMHAHDYRSAVRLFLISTVSLFLFVNVTAHSANMPSRAIDELPAIINQWVPEQLRRHSIPGAVVSVVANGQIVLSRGYGFADLERRIPATDTTVIRAGSVTKLFTWIAVMQLVEQGRLNLGADLNEYLQTFQIPPTYAHPITLANLMTHTAGFEDRWSGLFVRGPHELVPLAKYVHRALPQRVRPPGELAVYSNYGAVLAGYICEQVSGIPYELYIGQQILHPLGMVNTSFQQPLPSRPGITMAMGYIPTDSGVQRRPFEYVQAIPAGGISTTASDMARFMIGLLPNSGKRSLLLDTKILRLMHERQFTHHPDLPGTTYGFFERPPRGSRVIWHPGGGGAMSFLSLLALVPEDGIGIFASYNSMGGSAAREELLQHILDSLYPDRVRMPRGSLPESGDADRPASIGHPVDPIDGTYRTASYSNSTIEKLTTLAEVNVAVEEDGTLTVSGLSREPSRWAPRSGVLFERIGGKDLLAFRADSNGRVRYLTWSQAPAAGFEKATWYQTTSFHALILLFCIALFVSAAGTWLIMWLFRRGLDQHRQFNLLAYGAAGAAGVFNLIILGTFLRQILGRTEQSLAYGVSGVLLAALIVALLSPAVSLVVLVFAVRAWTLQSLSFFAQLHYSVIAVANVAFVWLLYYWNLLGFRF